MLYKIKSSKKGISVIIGYVLLVSFGIVIGVIVYQWMKTYVPQDDLNCPDGTSIFIKDYTCSSDILSITFKNNGKFSVGGYFIYATDNPNEKLATINISEYNVDPNRKKIPDIIKFTALTPRNALIPNMEEEHEYNITEMNGNIYSIEIVPVRWQQKNNKNILVSCKDIKIREVIECN